MESRISKFIDLAEYLYSNEWVHFKLSDDGWTKGLDGEDKIFGIVIRTLLCNDASSKAFFEDINGFDGAKSMYDDDEEDFVNWLNEKLDRYKMGRGKGSHRDGRHKKWTPQGIKEYLKLTQFKQKEYLDNIRGYNSLFNDLDSVYGIGPLTAFDITKSFYEAHVIDFLPDRFYLTGPGEIKGLKVLFPAIQSDEDLVEKGGQLVQAIIDRTGMCKEIACFGVEDLLCIYQKDKRYEKFLECSLSVQKYGSILFNRSCIQNRGVC